MFKFQDGAYLKSDRRIWHWFVVDGLLLLLSSSSSPSGFYFKSFPSCANSSLLQIPNYIQSAHTEGKCVKVSNCAQLNELEGWE